MVAALYDDHARWGRPMFPPAMTYGLGWTLSGQHAPDVDPVATAPLFVTSVEAAGPAVHAGMRAGDVIESVTLAARLLPAHR